MTINSQRKGMAGEREVVDILNAHGFPATRNGCYAKDDVTCFYGGQDLEPTIIEVKRKKMSSRELEEELKGRGEVWHRENNTDWKVTLKAKDYLALRLLARQ
jgi:Holliday junction resolvase